MLNLDSQHCHLLRYHDKRRNYFEMLIFHQRLQILLNFYLSELEKDDLLKTAMQQVINSDIPIQIDSTQALKLRSLGLIEFKGNEVQCLCDLYRLYFRERL